MLGSTEKSAFSHKRFPLDDICNVVFSRFCDVTKQNGHNSVETLYREPLGEAVVTMITFIKSKKTEKRRGEVITV